MSRIGNLGLAAVLLAAGAAWAAPAKDKAEAQAAIDARVAHFKEMGKAMEPIGNMLRKKQPYDAATVQQSAAKIAELAEKIPGLYEVDTRQFKDIKTEALDGIWTGQADYKAKAADLAKVATALSEASKGAGNASSFTRDAAAVGKACSSCHDAYRYKKS